MEDVRGDRPQNNNQGSGERRESRDFTRKQYERQKILEAERKSEKSQRLGREWRVQNLRIHFIVHKEDIDYMMGEIGTWPDLVKQELAGARQKYERLKNDFADVFTSFRDENPANPHSNELVRKATNYPVPHVRYIGHSTRNANEARLRSAVHELRQFHQSLRNRVQKEQLRMTREQNQNLVQQLQESKKQRATISATFKRFDTATNEVFEQLTQLEGTIDTASTDKIRLGLSEDEMAKMATYEGYLPPDMKIKEQNIPWKIKYCEYWIDHYKKEIANTNTPVAIMNGAREALDYLFKYKADLGTLQQKLRDQYHKIWKDVNNDVKARKKLRELRTKLERACLDFKKSMETLGNQESAHSSLNQAEGSYQAQLGPDAASPSVLTMSDMLAKSVDALENMFDAKIAKMHEKLKIAAEDLGLEEYHTFYLQQQIRKTKFYSEHLNLVHIRQAQRSFECGLICTLMAAADKNKSLLTIDIGMKILEEVEKLFPGEPILPTMGYAMLLKTIGHPIDYRYARARHYKGRLDTPDYDQKYYSHMGYYPQDNITAAELKKAIGQKDEKGDPITVIVSWAREREKNRDFYYTCHAVNVDALKVGEDGEEEVIYRNPATIEASITTGRLLGEGESMPWKDFLEIWSGVAIIPILDK